MRQSLNLLKTIDINILEELDLHLVCDRYVTHETATLKKRLLRQPRFHMLFTPASAS
ncbi:hypothetical protein SAMN04487905_11830 [Actinopolyspora xinjiangensis]|uniref:DDE superfamily endonuclease n=1 Tax=Actinopolyspora xinjiangensis TaxID=405564 RepID=A0A1H0WYB7_9ACTN|nr:hypothetical protein SAMN04487905_11830 [Actinopolyspora xinjiangensis]